MPGRQHGLMQDEPILIERSCGGWLAVAPDDALLHFGVTGDDADDARQSFKLATERWMEAYERARATDRSVACS